MKNTKSIFSMLLTFCILLPLLILPVSATESASYNPDGLAMLDPNMLWEGNYSDDELREFVQIWEETAIHDAKGIHIMILGDEPGYTREEYCDRIVADHVLPFLGENFTLESDSIVGMPLYLLTKEEVYDACLALLLHISHCGECRISPMPAMDVPDDEKGSDDGWDDDYPFIRGDCNSDGKVNALDYLLLKNCILKNTIEKMIWGTADLNFDCKINALDYIILKRYILGVLPELPPVQPWD